MRSAGDGDIGGNGDDLDHRYLTMPCRFFDVQGPSSFGAACKYRPIDAAKRQQLRVTSISSGIDGDKGRSSGITRDGDAVEPSGARTSAQVSRSREVNPITTISTFLRPCIRFARDGSCSYGAACKFAHIRGHEAAVYRGRRLSNTSGSGYAIELRGHGGARMVEQVSITMATNQMLSTSTFSHPPHQPKGPTPSVGADEKNDPLPRHGDTIQAPTSGFARKTCRLFDRIGYCYYGADSRMTDVAARKGIEGPKATAATRRAASTETDVTACAVRHGWSGEMMLKLPKERRLNGVYGDWIEGGSPRKT